MAWTIKFEQDAIRQLNRLDKAVRRRIVEYLELRVAASGDPRQFGKPLRRDKMASGRIGLVPTGSFASWSRTGWWSSWFRSATAATYTGEAREVHAACPTCSAG